MPNINFPAIPEPRPNDPDSIIASVAALKRAFEMLAGIKGPQASTAITYATLPDAVTAPGIGLHGPAGAAGGRGVPIPGLDGEDADPMMIPGPRGFGGERGFFGQPGVDGEDGDTIIVRGPPGAVGGPGFFGPPGMDGEDGDVTHIPGAQGPAGIGFMGPPGYDGDDGDTIVIPGLLGAPGAAGRSIPGEPGEDGGDWPLGYTTPALTAAFIAAMAEKNVLQNGAMQISQTNGSNVIGYTNNVATTNPDFWDFMYNHGAATAVFVGARQSIATLGPVGASWAALAQASTALSAPANLDFAKFRQTTTGYKIASWGWGQAGAKGVTVCAIYFATVSGTAFAKISNAAQTRCYYHEIVLASGYNSFAFVVPGDQTGTWANDSTTGLTFELFFAGKEATPVSALDAWGTTNKVATTNNTNFFNANSTQIYLTAVFVGETGGVLPNISDMAAMQRTFVDDVVPNANLAYMALNTMKGNNTTLGAPLDLTADQTATLIRTGTGTKGVLKSKAVIGSRDMTAASGSVAYTGVGFKPTMIICLGSSAPAAAYESTIGFVDESGAGPLCLIYITIAGAFLSSVSGTLLYLADPGNGATKFQTAALTSFDTDGFTLAWTKTGAPAANTASLLFLCLR